MVPISVVEINGQSPGTLNYTDHNEPGLSVIPICGFLLSLGLTLAGVTISYFLRNPMMYDPPPLMQMGRWFGFRKGYEDLVRVH